MTASVIVNRPSKMQNVRALRDRRKHVCFSEALSFRSGVVWTFWKYRLSFAHICNGNPALNHQNRPKPHFSLTLALDASQRSEYDHWSCAKKKLNSDQCGKINELSPFSSVPSTKILLIIPACCLLLNIALLISAELSLGRGSYCFLVSFLSLREEEEPRAEAGQRSVCTAASYSNVRHQTAFTTPGGSLIWLCFNWLETNCLVERPHAQHVTHFNHERKKVL